MPHSSAVHAAYCHAIDTTHKESFHLSIYSANIISINATKKCTQHTAVTATIVPAIQHSYQSQ